MFDELTEKHEQFVIIIILDHSSRSAITGQALTQRLCHETFIALDTA